MKKTSKLFGAVALSAALAMGCAVPAFATPDTGSNVEPGLDTYTNKNAEGGIYDSNGAQDITDNPTASTAVNVFTKIDQINVAVPMQITVIARAEGGDLYTPSAGLKKYSGSGNYDKTKTTGYRIENYSSVAVDITKIEAAAVPGKNWNLKTTAQVNDALGATDIGNIALTLAPTDKADNKDDGVNEGNQNTTGGTTAIDVADATAASTPNWTVKGTMIDGEPAIMGIQVGGKSSKLQNLTSKSLLDQFLSSTDGTKYADNTAHGKTAENVVNITYTIAANTK